MGYTEPELYEDDLTIIERIMGEVGRPPAASSRSRVLARCFLTGRRSSSSPTSPSRRRVGRSRFASARAEADGHPRLPLADADPRPESGRLRLLTPASPWLMNDSYANDERIADRMGEATVTLHPEDAAAPRPAEGQRVRPQQRDGQPGACAGRGETIPQGVALSPKGRWPRQEGTKANVNVLNPGIKSDMGESTCVHGVEVEIVAV